jgi:hypothetical protein
MASRCRNTDIMMALSVVGRREGAGNLRAHRRPKGMPVRRETMIEV